jgi:RimJ/RimL family protein N-acetyltransferase
MFAKLGGIKNKAIIPMAKTFTSHNAVIEAIINETEPGSIFVDDTKKPSTFFIHQKDGFFFLHGKYSESFFSLISDYLFKELKLSCIEIILSDSLLEKSIPIIFDNRKHKIFHRKIFSLNRAKYESDFPAIRTDSLPDIVLQIENKQDRLSLRLLKDNNVVASCRTIIGEKEAEISIETEEEYRRKGYATFAAKKIVDLILERNLAPVWSCWEFNEPSIKLAEKICFQPANEIQVYLWDIYI